MANIQRQRGPRTHLVIPDSHAHPGYSNDRADWLGRFMLDLKPDVVVNIGDMWDMPSMSSYDKGTKSFQGRTYKDDLDAGLDFDERLWAPTRRAKKRKPFSVFLEGNHEFRLKKAVELTPELDKLIGFNDFDLDRNYNVVVQYNGGTPGIVQIDGVHYAHYFISGVKGLPISGEHAAYSLITKQAASCTAGHLHTLDFSSRKNVNGKWRMGLVCGVYQDYDAPWAGHSNDLWWRGVIVKREVEDGYYEHETIGIDRLRREYGK